MKLFALLSGLDYKIIGNIHKKVQKLSNIAQDCDKNTIYFCLNGRENNGADYIQLAIENGCNIIVCESSCTTLKGVTQIIVDNARKAMSIIAANFYEKPAEKLKIIGVTGTNGKTTTTTMIHHLLSKKYSVGLIGTNGAKFNGKCIDTGFTTPDPIMLHELFREMVDCGIEYVVMEMSAHAIYLDKLYGINPYIVAFTNLTQDHLDYFENIDNYYNAKAKLFKEYDYQKSVICIDGNYGETLLHDSKHIITCSSNKKADIFIENVTHNISGQTFAVQDKTGSGVISVGLLGGFNLQNSIIAISVCRCIGLTFDEIATYLKDFEGVDGRFQNYILKNCNVIVDYAHTPDGLYNLLITAREVAENSKLICVFGCGGNRDRDKRPIMGAIAEKYADYTIVTTDNPRFEDNYKIAMEICQGFVKRKHEIILDRGQAIRTAISKCKKGDIVVVAGKGAEPYIDINGTKVDYSDKKQIEKILKEE